MSKEIKLETLSDVLNVDETSLKTGEKSEVIKRIKQLLKVENKSEEVADKEAEEYPYTGVSIVGNKLVVLKFDLADNSARIVNVSVDSRDRRGKNVMATAEAVNMIKRLRKSQIEQGGNDE